MENGVHKLYLILFFIAVLMFITGMACDEYKKPEINQKYNLRKLDNEQYFDFGKKDLFFEYIDGTTRIESDFYILFSWEYKPQEYMLSILPSRLIRIHVVENIEIPTIRFRWKFDNGFIKDTDINLHTFKSLLFDLNYVLIECREDQWPKNLQFTGLKIKES